MVAVYQGDSCWREAALKQSPGYAKAADQAVQEWALDISRRAEEIEKTARSLKGRLRLAQSKGKLSLVLGAGVSISCGFPSWNDLIQKTARSLLTKKNLLYEEIDGLLSVTAFGNDLLSVSQALTSFADESELIDSLAHVMFSCETHRSDLLRSLGKLLADSYRLNRQRDKPTVVLTFNYDTLIEEELGRLKIPFTSWDRNTSLLALPLDSVNVVHAHGILRREPPHGSGIVFTESSYGQAYLRDTRTDPLSDLLEREYTPLFVGFSFRDYYVRRVLHERSIRSGKPVAATVLASEGVVDLKKWAEISAPAWSAYNQSEMIGWRLAGVNPVENRHKKILKLPSYFVRWILSSIGVEWYEVQKHRDTSSALAALLRHK